MPHPDPTPIPWDRHTLYELCAQNPPRDTRLLLSILNSRKSNPTLGEDFCGTAALSRAWCQLLPRGRAIAVDIDKPTLARAKQLAPAHPPTRITFIRADVMRAKDKADLIAVLNFSICEIHERPALIKYLRHARSRLSKGGAVICDLYGGVDAFETSTVHQRIIPPGYPHAPRGAPRSHRERIIYSWEQREADPLTGRVLNAMHFEVGGACHRPSALRRSVRETSERQSTDRSKQRSVAPDHLILQNAFIYNWRLWSIPELRDAMHEAGFRSTHIYPRAADATDSAGNLYVHPIEDPADLPPSYNVLIAARK